MPQHDFGSLPEGVKDRKERKVMRKISILLFSLCFLFSGCSSELENGMVNSAGLEGIIDGTEPLQEIEDVEDIAFPNINDNWPESFSLSNKGLYADRLTATIEIEEPMELMISCVTESGRLDISIVDDSQNPYFDQSDIVTGEYTADIREAGTYTIILKADYHVGSITIKPAT